MMEAVWEMNSVIKWTFMATLKPTASLSTNALHGHDGIFIWQREAKLMKIKVCSFSFFDSKRDVYFFFFQGPEGRPGEDGQAGSPGEGVCYKISWFR